MLPIVINILLVIHVLVSLLIVLIVLMQRPKNEGLGAAFGGGMTENLFGAQTTNVLQTITRWLGGMFFALTLALSILYVKQSSSRSAVQEKLTNAPVPTATPLPAAPAPVVGKEAGPDENEKLELAPAKGTEAETKPGKVFPLEVPPEAATQPIKTPSLPAPDIEAPSPLPPTPGTVEKALPPSPEKKSETPVPPAAPANPPSAEGKSNAPSPAPANPPSTESKPVPPADPAK